MLGLRSRKQSDDIQSLADVPVGETVTLGVSHVDERLCRRLSQLGLRPGMSVTVGRSTSGGGESSMQAQRATPSTPVRCTRCPSWVRSPTTLFLTSLLKVNNDNTYGFLNAKIRIHAQLPCMQRRSTSKGWCTCCRSRRRTELR